MLDTIEKLLVLQDRDRRVFRHRHQLSRIGPEQEALLGQAEGTKLAFVEAKTVAKSIESARRELELEAESKDEQIKKYSSQQLQTKKNEEYRALANEINSCKKAISDLEDKQLELLEQIDKAQADVKTAETNAQAAKNLANEKVGDLEQREVTLKQELEVLLEERTALTAHLDHQVLNRYERLLKLKGENCVVGVDRGICAGCHVKLPVQIMISCQAQREVVNCSNCGRIVYFGDGMRREPLE
jgi:predicted  nucleic acid-binding Zn-ribbon protein